MEFTTLLGLLFAVFVTVMGSQPAVVNLGTAGNYVILAETAISSTGTTKITGNIGLSPAAASFITGFSLVLSVDGTYSTSNLVNAPGKLYAANYANPTPTTLTTAVSDMGAAYTDAAGRINPNFLNLNAGSLNSQTLSPGLYKWTTPLTLAGTITLSGTATSIFIFQTTGTLEFKSGCIITLSGGVLAKNVFWQSAGVVTLDGTSAVKGNILAKTKIVFLGGASLVGKALAQTAVTLIANTITYA